MAALKLEIVTPTGKVLETTADAVTAPGVEGEFTVLPDHRPGLILLGGGAIRYEGPKGSGVVYVRGGVAEIGPDKVLVLADEAQKPENADTAKAAAILEQVQEAFEDPGFLDDAKLLALETDRRFGESVLRERGH